MGDNGLAHATERTPRWRTTRLASAYKDTAHTASSKTVPQSSRGLRSEIAVYALEVKRRSPTVP